MREEHERSAVPTGYIVLALLLLIGVLAVGFGYFSGRTAVLYAGVAVIVAGVVSGIVAITGRS
jgi:uncharacterized membrane protein HdeD (DUF308 family)